MQQGTKKMKTLNKIKFTNNIHAWNTNSKHFTISNGSECFIFRDITLKGAIHQLLNHGWSLNDVCFAFIKLDDEVKELRNYIYIA